jgi:uncharacterized protein YceH (UPF0502 family)
MPALALDPLEARILGVLIEKELTTPEQYPLSLNALVAGCNQKSNRDPVLELSDADVREGIEQLRRKSLVGAAHAAGARVERYRHAAATVWELAPNELAVMAELMLRGAQQPGELRGRADRMSRIETLDVLANLLEGLRARGFVRRLEPLPGARAPCWEQILVASEFSPSAPVSAAQTGMPIRRPSSASTESEPASSPAGIQARPAAPASSGGIEARVAALEAEVARLARLYREPAGPPG